MDNKKEIESELLSITEKYKRDFAVKFDRSKDALSSMIERLNLLGELGSKLTEELVDAANKHFAKYDIDDTSEAVDFIQNCYLDFAEYVKSVD